MKSPFFRKSLAIKIFQNGEISEIGGQRSADPGAQRRNMKIGKIWDPYNKNGSQIGENSEKYQKPKQNPNPFLAAKAQAIVFSANECLIFLAIKKHLYQ